MVGRGSLVFHSKGPWWAIICTSSTLPPKFRSVGLSSSRIWSGEERVRSDATLGLGREQQDLRRPRRFRAEGPGEAFLTLGFLLARRMLISPRFPPPSRGAPSPSLTAGPVWMGPGWGNTKGQMDSRNVACSAETSVWGLGRGPRWGGGASKLLSPAAHSSRAHPIWGRGGIYI